MKGAMISFLLKSRKYNGKAGFILENTFRPCTELIVMIPKDIKLK